VISGPGDFQRLFGLECVRNLDVTARILLNRESSFLIFCDFKELRAVECGKNITFCNLYVLSLTTIVWAHHGQASFEDRKKRPLSNG
jgi:hypothetical protein